MSTPRRWLRRLALVLVILLAATALILAPELARMDFRHLGSRAAWQVPDRVIQSLGLHRGASVADIGAGDGYFTFRFAEAVGPEGRVYAVEVEDDLVADLKSRAEAGGFDNVVVVRGQYDNPLLPDGAIDLVFMCNSYHHIESRPGYFRSLRQDLSGDGRVALVDLRPGPLVRLTAPAGHWTPLDQIVREMGEASYALVGSFDDLPIQNFAVFRPRSP